MQPVAAAVVATAVVAAPAAAAPRDLDLSPPKTFRGAPPGAPPLYRVCYCVSRQLVPGAVDLPPPPHVPVGGTRYGLVLMRGPA